MTNTSAAAWKDKRTAETRTVEEVLRAAGFEQFDAYRYNSASIRLRIIDSRFQGMSPAERDAMVEPYLAKLSERTQADIMSLYTFSPSELQQTTAVNIRTMLLNAEFDDPSDSML